jgi:hypothetical protein
MDGATAMPQMSPVVIIVYVVVCLLMYVLFAIPLMKIGNKKNLPGWFAWVPILNYVLIIQIAEKPIWWIIMILIVPCANIIFLIMLFIAFFKAIDKSPAWTWALLFPILLLIPLYSAAKE